MSGLSITAKVSGRAMSYPVRSLRTGPVEETPGPVCFPPTDKIGSIILTQIERAGCTIARLEQGPLQQREVLKG